jgi:hypothetical protein
MIPPFRIGGRVAPTAEQRLLLRAALLEGEPGREAWERWRGGIEIERLDAGSQRLLPQLYRNVHTYATDGRLLERLKGVYRHAWSANGVLLRDAGRVLGALAHADIRTVVLDGTALVPLYYRDQGARAIDSITVMISPDDVPAAALVLAREGWGSAELAHRSRPGPYTSQARLLGAGRPIDLLWDPFPEGCTPDIRRSFWASAEPAHIAGVANQALAPGEELLRICVRASRWEEPSPFRRLADALVLLRSAGPRVDWTRLVDQARRSQVVLPVLASLSLLRELLDAPVPDATLRRLEADPPGAGEWLEQRLREAPRPRLGRLPDLLCRYRRLATPEHVGTRRPGLARFLQGAWGVRSAWQLPLVALGKGVRLAIHPKPSFGDRRAGTGDRHSPS